MNPNDLTDKELAEELRKVADLSLVETELIQELYRRKYEVSYYLDTSTHYEDYSVLPFLEVDITRPSVSI